MSIKKLSLFVMFAFAFQMLPAQVNAQGQPFSAIPFRDPQLLEQWLALDTPAFQALLQNNWPAVESELNGHFPPGLVISPVSHGFAGPQRTCLQDHTPLACRIYMGDLARINRQRAGGPPAGTLNNPFANR